TVSLRALGTGRDPAGEMSKLRNSPSSLHRSCVLPGLSSALREGIAALRGEALSECHQQLRWALQADPPPQQGPQEAALPGEEAQPGLAVGGHAQVGSSLVALPDREGPVLDRDRRLLLLL